eukprot:g5853.t1
MGAFCCKGKLPEVDENLNVSKTLVVERLEVPEDPPTSLVEDPAVVEERIKHSKKYRQNKPVREVYKFGRTLGTGGFSVVKLVTERSTSIQYACKIMLLPDVDRVVEEYENSRNDIFKEIEILCRTEHENVLYLKEFFIEGNKVYLITELLTGGELLEAVLEHGNYSEADARSCFRQVLKGIAYLHSKGIVHRDLKLENLMFTSDEAIPKVKIVDFGLAKSLQKGTNKMGTICGTPQYVAPEIIKDQDGKLGYSKSVDMWSAGVILFILLGGYPPFHDDNESMMFELITSGKFAFEDPVWENISPNAKKLIKRLLTVDPETRPTAEECLEDDWFIINPPEQLLSTTTANLKKNYQKQFRKAVNVIITVNKMKRLAIAEEETADSSLILDDDIKQISFS